MLGAQYEKLLRIVAAGFRGLVNGCHWVGAPRGQNQVAACGEVIAPRALAPLQCQRWNKATGLQSIL